MIAIENFNKLSITQQGALHESVGRFLKENFKELKSLRFVDESILTGYMSKVAALHKSFQACNDDSSLNDTLSVIISAAEQNEDNETANNLLNQITLRYQQMKNLDCSLNLIHSLRGQAVIIAEFAMIQGAQTIITIEDNVIYVEYTLPFTKDARNVVQNLSDLHITLGGSQYFAEEGNFYVESFMDGLDGGGQFTGRIRINQLASTSFDRTGKAYYRCMIPIGSIDWDRDIHTYTAIFRNRWSLGLVELKDGETLLHVYPCSDNEKRYMVIESLTTTTHQKMTEYVYSVALTLGFISGTIHLGKCYEFSSTEPEFGEDVGMTYQTMRPSSENVMRIFTTNMYYVREMLKLNKVNLQDKSPLYSDKDEFQEHLQDWLQPDMLQRLFTLIHNDEKVARAVVTITESGSFPLEYQASVRAIVLETLAHSVPGPKPITDDVLWEAMKKELDDVVANYAKNEAGEPLISEESLSILRKKIVTMNNPTNADSLARPIEETGYALNKNDKEALKMRNALLHGSLVKGDYAKQSNELFYISLMLHKLACIIILKRAGFEGYIMNNPVLFNCEKAIKANEKVLIKI